MSTCPCDYHTYPVSVKSSNYILPAFIQCNVRGSKINALFHPGSMIEFDQEELWYTLEGADIYVQNLLGLTSTPQCQWKINLGDREVMLSSIRYQCFKSSRKVADQIQKNRRHIACAKPDPQTDAVDDKCVPKAGHGERSSVKVKKYKVKGKIKALTEVQVEDYVETVKEFASDWTPDEKIWTSIQLEDFLMEHPNDAPQLLRITQKFRSMTAPKHMCLPRYMCVFEGAGTTHEIALSCVALRNIPAYREKMEAFDDQE